MEEKGRGNGIKKKRGNKNTYAIRLRFFYYSVYGRKEGRKGREGKDGVDKGKVP